VWDLYLNFLIFFTTFASGVFVWFFGDPRDQLVTGGAALLFIVQCLVVALTSSKMALHMEQSEVKDRDILNDLKKLVATDDAVSERCFQVTFPYRFLRHGARSSAVRLVVFAITWLVLAILTITHSPKNGKAQIGDEPSQQITSPDTRLA
jgi:preprotein translocase subunit SecG